LRQGSIPRALRRASPWALALAAALGLAACGGGGNPSAPSLATAASVNAASTAPGSAPSGGFQQLVVFGDSLSDDGAYTLAAVSTYSVAPYNIPFTGALPYPAGGQFTVNGVGNNWTTQLATMMNLNLTPNLVGFGTPVGDAYLTPTGEVTSAATATCTFNTPQSGTSLPSCTDYAQGGSMVSNPDGIGHSTGALTLPMTTQLQNYLTQYTSFNADQLVVLLGGNNDVFSALSGVQTQVTAAVTQAVSQAVAANPALTAAQIAAIEASTTQTATAAAVSTAQATVAQAADELASLADQTLSKGAKYVLVYTLPDSALTPFGQSLAGGTTCDVQDPTQACYLLSNLVNVFNQQLLNDLQGKAVKVIDGHALLAQEIANPAQFGLSNVTTPWCSPLTGGSPTSAPNSLLCNAETPNTAAGASLANVGSWLFADGVHPTPAGYTVIANATHAALISYGWAQ
jgi:phospholipase/lecithinase/hemolysin